MLIIKDFREAVCALAHTRKQGRHLVTEARWMAATRFGDNFLALKEWRRFVVDVVVRTA